MSSEGFDFMTVESEFSCETSKACKNSFCQKTSIAEPVLFTSEQAMCRTG